MIDIQNLKNNGEIWLGGTSKMYELTDGNKKYIFKPSYKKGTTIEEPFRAYAQEAAYELQKIIDEPSAIECRALEYDGVIGAVQEKIDVDQNLTHDILLFQQGKKGLTEEYIKSIFREYITDYLLCNYDSHARNFIVGKDGILRGVDKEQCFKYIQKDGSDDPKFSINFNKVYGELPSIYTVIFNKLETGELSPDLLQCLDEYVQKINNYPDDEYTQIFKKYAESVAPSNPDSVLSKIKSRKENLQKVVSNLKEQYKEKNSEIDQSLQDLLNEVMKLPYITTKTKQLSKDLSSDESKNIRNMLVQAFNYCIILKNKAGIEEFLEIKDDKTKFELLKNKVALKLGIHPDQIEEKKDEIYKYIYDSCNENGFVYHITNSVAEAEIKKTGLTGENRIWQNEELLKINSIYEKYNRHMPLGWAVMDIQHNKNGWFCDYSPSGIPHYSSSPEWMGEFCGGSMMYDGEVPQEKRKAFHNRDYDIALENIEHIQHKAGFSQADAEEVTNFFNKYWNIYKDAVPRAILVPRKEVNEGESIPYDWSKENYSPLFGNRSFHEYMENLLMEETIYGRYQMGKKDVLVQKDISPEKLLYVDISGLFERKKIQKRDGLECKLSFGKHDPIPFEEKYAAYFSGLRGYDDLYFLQFLYPDVNSKEAQEVSLIVENLMRWGKVTSPYLINSYGEATADSSGIVGGIYFKPEFLDEITSLVSNIKNAKITGMQESEKTAQQHKADMDLEQLMTMIKGLDFKQRQDAIKLIDMLSKGSIDIEKLEH